MRRQQRKSSERKIIVLVVVIVFLVIITIITPFLIFALYPQTREDSILKNRAEQNQWRNKILEKIPTKVVKNRAARPKPEVSYLLIDYGEDEALNPDFDTFDVYRNPLKTYLAQRHKHRTDYFHYDDRWEPVPGDSVQQELFRSQHPEDCSTARLLVLDYINENECSHGCQIHYTSLALSFAYMAKRTLLINHTSHWMLKGEGEENDFYQGYILPLGSCTISDIRPEEYPLKPAICEGNPETDFDRVVFIDTEVMWPWMQRAYAAQVPIKFSNVEKDLFWWRSQLVTYIMRPSAQTEKIIREEEERLEDIIGFKSKQKPFLGIHMRHGVSTIVKGNRNHFQFDEYLSVAEELISATHWTNPFKGDESIPDVIFLSTEHVDELNQAKQFAESKRLMVAHTVEIETDAHSLLLEQRAINYRQLHIICIKNIFIQLRSQIFIGTLSSNFGRLVVELQYGLGKIVRSASLDKEWFVNP